MTRWMTSQRMTTMLYKVFLCYLLMCFICHVAFWYLVGEEDENE